MPPHYRQVGPRPWGPGSLASFRSSVALVFFSWEKRCVLGVGGCGSGPDEPGQRVERSSSIRSCRYIGSVTCARVAGTPSSSHATESGSHDQHRPEPNGAHWVRCGWVPATPSRSRTTALDGATQSSPWLWRCHHRRLQSQPQPSARCPPSSKPRRHFSYVAFHRGVQDCPF